MDIVLLIHALLNFNKLPPSCCLQFYDNIVLIKKYKSFIDKEYKSNFDFSTSNIESLLKDSVSGANLK